MEVKLEQSNKKELTDKEISHYLEMVKNGATLSLKIPTGVWEEEHQFKFVEEKEGNIFISQKSKEMDFPIMVKYEDIITLEELDDFLFELQMSLVEKEVR